ncbi:MAG: 50S ribosomal protein L30 [Gammaproteobacteria bacterium]
MVTTRTIKVTLLKSKYGRRANHQACLRGLGLRRIRQTVVVADTPENRGMIGKVNYLVKVEEL